MRIVTGRQVGNRQVCEVQEGGMDERQTGEICEMQECWGKLLQADR